MTINLATYSPRPDSVAGRTLRVIQNERGIWTSARLAQRLGASDQAIRVALSSLRRAGLIEAVPHHYRVSDQ